MTDRERLLESEVTNARLAVNDWHNCSTQEELDRWRAAQHRLISAAKALGEATVSDQRDELLELVRAIQQSTREDEKGEQWTIRTFLEQRNVYDGDIQGSRRLVAEACRNVLGWMGDSPPKDTP